MATEFIGFRLSTSDRDLLDALAGEHGNRSETLRKLIYEEAERRHLTQNAAERFLQRLRDEHGADAVLRVAVDGGGQPDASIDDQPIEGINLVHGPGPAELRLDDPGGRSSLVLAELGVTPGLQLELTYPLADLRPEMHRAG